VLLVRRLAFLTLLGALMGVLAPAAWACQAGTYTYAGLAGGTSVFGVGASITPAPTAFNVVAGHVAGWVGVGGPGEGPNGTDEWIQVGFSAFPLLFTNDVYYEVAQPNGAPTYHRVLADVASGSAMRVAVLEMHGRPDWWRVWVNGAAVSAPIHLAASHGRWRPIVTAESWDGGASSCNDFLYRFDAIRVTRAPGGLWSPLTTTQSIDNANSLVVRRAPGAFDAAGGANGLRSLASVEQHP